MKRIAILAILAILLAFTAYAESAVPDGVQVFYLDGMTCFVWPDGSGDCYCPCECVELTATIEPEPTFVVTNTPGPRDTPVPSATPIPPVPTERGSCNRGIGNLDEGCDPGNSSEQGRGEGRRAGEDRDEPVGP